MGEFKPVTVANSPALMKCGTNSECDSEDRISKLPNDVLLSVMRLLKFKEAAATSALSRRWVYLWKSNLVLDFDAIETLQRVALHHSLRETERAKYINWVNLVLAVHEGSVIEQFRVLFDLSKVNEKDIDNWLKFAFARRVQQLVLDLSGYGMFAQKPEQIYAFPAQLCVVQPRTSSTLVGFKSLKTLYFSCVNVTGYTVEFFLSNCPFLESVAVCYSAGLVNLEVSGQSLRLRSLSISNCKNLESIKVFSTNLVKFWFNGNVDALYLHDLPSLIEAVLWGFWFSSDVFVKFHSYLSKLEILRLDWPCSNSTRDLTSLPRLSRLKEVTLGFHSSNDTCFLECASLVDVFPCMQKLVIELWWSSPERSGREVSESIPFHPHKSIKQVTLVGYYGGTSDLELATYFLKNAVALEELIIDPRSPFYIYSRLPKPSEVFEKEESARTFAKQQLRTFAKQQLKGITMRPSIKLKMVTAVG